MSSDIAFKPTLVPEQKLLEVHGLERTFSQGGETLTVLKDLSLSINKGEMVALVGPSGAGKSTLLQMIGLLDSPTRGSISINGQEVTGQNERQRTMLRREFIGFVYQFHYLLPEFSALENVVLPQMIAGKSRADARDHATMLLKALGLGHRLDHRRDPRIPGNLHRCPQPCRHHADGDPARCRGGAHRLCP